MRTIIVAIAATALGGAVVTSSAWSKGHDEPGVPGTPNCHGQTMAYLNQLAGEQDPPIHGIGNLAEFSGLSVQDVQAIVDEFCSSDDGGP